MKKFTAIALVALLLVGILALLVLGVVNVLAFPSWKDGNRKALKPVIH